jgi:hypothetical protein
MATTNLWDEFALRTEAGASDLELAVRAVINEGPLAPIIPWVNIGSMAYPYAMDDELPVVGPRLFNEENATGKGTYLPQTEIVKIYGADIETDVSQLALQGPGVHARSIEQTARAIRLEAEAGFVRGNSALTQGRSMDGLATKIPRNDSASQAIANHATGAGLSFGALDELINEVDAESRAKRLIVPRKMIPRFSQASRNVGVAGTVDFELNGMGRRVLYYGDVEIVATDVDSQNVPIQGFNEPGDTCSIYCVALGEGMVSGIQGPSLDENRNPVEGLVVYDVGESNKTPTMLTRISWHIAMVVETKRAAARLFNITNAAFTA